MTMLIGTFALLTLADSDSSTLYFLCIAARLSSANFRRIAQTSATRLQGQFFPS